MEVSPTSSFALPSIRAEIIPRELRAARMKDGDIERMKSDPT